MPECPECGSTVQSGDAFCTSCGAPLDGHEAPRADHEPRPSEGQRSQAAPTVEDGDAGAEAAASGDIGTIAAGSVTTEGPIESVVSEVTESTVDLFVRAWNVLVANPTSFVVFAVVAVLLVVADTVDPAVGTFVGLLAGFGVAVGVGVVVNGVDAVADGEAFAVGTLLGRTAARLPVAVVAGVAWGLLVTLGLLLLVLPGLYLAVRFAFVAHAVFLEGASPVAAFRASWARSRGHLLPISGVVGVLFIGSIVFNLVPVIGGALVSLILTPVGIAALTHLYLDLEAGDAASVT